MRKSVTIGAFLLCCFLILVPLGYGQEKGESLVQKAAQSGIRADSSDYVIGPEDVLYIHVWKEETLSRTVPVRADGRISLPLIDEVEAAGLTPLQLKETLMKKIKEYVEVPNVSVIVVEPNSFKVYISGQVRTPGVQRLRSESSLLQVIAMCGGFTEWANQKKILVIRKEGGQEKRITVNYKKIVEGRGLETNFLLKPGDIIIVP
jgi:polysaccharide biosynthesis/export protein